MIRSFLRASALTPFFFGVALAQDDTTLIDEVTVTDRILEVDDQPEAIDLIPAVEARALVHPSEALNAVAGVNIHRGSGQEHLTAIRSPVLTGGAGAGSFLYL